MWLRNAKDGDIILLHDIYPSSVAAALRIVDELKARGFIFVTVDDISYKLSPEYFQMIRFTAI